jgi:glycosyltransferase involved in cell wall biosynthesis
MNILIGHNYYKDPGGEDAVFHSHAGLLERFGHQVLCYRRHNDEVNSGLFSRTRHLATLRFSRRSYRDMRRLIRDFRPDIAHFHNVYFVMTPAVFYACQDEGVPVVVSLHNFRLMCINGLLFRDHKPCEDCLQKGPCAGIKHRCYRRSLFLSSILTDMMCYHRRKHTWSRAVDRFIVATAFSRGKFVEMGIAADRIDVLPHFVENPTALSGGQGRGDFALYAGRLSNEKGVKVLLNAWRDIKGVSLYITGTGPLRVEIEEQIKREGLSNVKMLGFLQRDEYIKVLTQARFIVVPSLCYENFPRVIVEAYGYGVPVLASRLGSIEEIVADRWTGLLFTPGDAVDLASKAMALLGDKVQEARMSAEAHRTYELNYTPQHHYEVLMRIYQHVLNTR